MATRTIRQHFRHRVRVILLGVAVAWFLLPLGAALSQSTARQGSRAVAVGLFAIAATIVIGSLIALLRVHCPRCGGSLTHLGSDVTFPIGGRSRVERCPHCGVSLDEPL